MNVISVVGLVAFPILLSYSSSKAALHSITQTTRQLLRGQGTFVAGVYPGPVDTDSFCEDNFQEMPATATKFQIASPIAG